MTDKIFDDFVKQNLYNKSSQVPKGLWEKIMAGKEEKPKGFWWKNRFSLSILTLGIIGCGIYSYNKINPIIFVNEPIGSNINTVVEPQLNTKLPINDILETEKKEKRGEILMLENEKNKEKVILKNPEASTVKSKTGYNFYQKDLTQNTSINSLNSFGNLSQISREERMFLDKNKTQKSYPFSSNLFLDNSNLNTTKEISQIDFYTKSGKSLFNENDKLPIINLRKILGLDDCPTARGQSRNDLYLEAYSSADYTIKRVQNTSASAAYLAKKDSAEKMIGGFTVGLRISKSIGENLFFKTGIQYAQMMERFTLKTENERRETRVVSIRTIVRAGLADTTISDTSTVVQIGYRTFQNTNLFRSIEIPVLLSYEFGKADHNWKFGVTGGVIVSASTSYKGNTINEANQLVDLNVKASNTAFYTHQIGLSLYASASIVKKINNTVDVFAEPYFRYSFNKNTIGIGFVQQFDAIGFNIGTRIKLNRKKH